MTYQGIVYIGNEIRYVLETARQVNLAAQNASLAARRAGNVLGFQAVSVELKSFSQGLAAEMDKMSTDILGIAHCVSAGYRQQRRAGHYHSAETLAGNVAALAQAQLRVASRNEVMRAALGERVYTLAQQLRRSIQRCGNGRALARSAMIEARGGGESEQMLRNVAHDIERTIEDVYRRLKLIAARLYNEQESM